MAPTSREFAILDLIVHELRTPLAVAAGSLPQVSADAALTEPQRAAAERVARALRQLNALADQLRAWSRVADSHVRTPVPIAAALAQALKAADARKREIRLVLSEMPPDIQIMSGAAPFIPTLAAIVAAVVRSAPNRSTVPVAVTADSTDVRIAVGDLTDAPESAFPAEFVGGLGFSMPLARAAIEGAGGRIWSKSVEGRVAGIGVAMPRM